MTKNKEMKTKGLILIIVVIIQALVIGRLYKIADDERCYRIILEDNFNAENKRGD